jgi:RNA polymerase sigma factor (sigma-70 family)
LLPICVILFEQAFRNIFVNKELEETYNLKGLNRNEFITTIYNRYGKKLYTYAIRTWSMDEDATWDLIYKTLYKVIDSYANYQFESEEKFASFIFKIFINYLRNHYRDNKSDKMFEFTAMDDVDLSTRETKDDEEKNGNKKLIALNEVLEKMEDWERMLLLMRSEGRAYSEIAQYIDKPENQLKVYYQRLKEQVTKKLNERSEQ